MKVDVALIPEDVMEFRKASTSKAAQPQQSKSRPTFVIIGTLAICALWFFFSTKSIGQNYQSLVRLSILMIFAAMACVLCMLVIYLAPIVELALLRKAFREGQYGNPLQPTTIKLSATGFERESDVITSIRFWHAIHATVLTSECIIVYPTPSTGDAIPRRAFPSDAAFREFFETAQRYHAAASSSSPDQALPK
jgi:hypothetical protein